nr:hypothetical protein [uncultured Fluviicola sp.]
MKFLLFIPLFAVLLTTSCNKENKDAEYILAVTGSDYADDAYILCQANAGMLSRLSLSGGEATINGAKKCKLSFLFPSHTLNNYAPEHQTDGDVINITIYQSKKGKKGKQVGETSLACSNYDEYPTPVDIEW